jgi:hypothetical protein
MSIEEEFLIESEFDYLVIQFERKLATVLGSLVFQGLWAVGGHEGLQVVHEVHLVHVQVTVFSLQRFRFDYIELTLSFSSSKAMFGEQIVILTMSLSLSGFTYSVSAIFTKCLSFLDT